MSGRIMSTVTSMASSKLHQNGRKKRRVASGLVTESDNEASPNEDASAPLKRNVYPRKRAATACQSCRLRKKKCDNERPYCGFCKSSGITCQYITASDTSTFDAASLAILDRLSVVESLLRDRQDAAPPVYGSQPTSKAYKQFPANGIIRSNKTSHSEGSKPSTDTTPAQVAELSFFLRDRAELDPEKKIWPVPGSDRTLQMPCFQTVFESLPKHRFLDPDGHERFNYLDDQARNSNQQSTRASDTEDFSTSCLDVDRLVSRFVKGVHVRFPILDGAEFKKYCEAFCDKGPVWDLATCLVLLVCALGALAEEFELRDYEVEGPDPYEGSRRTANLRLANLYFTAAEKRLGFAIGTPGKLSAQCLCLAAVYNCYTLRPLSAKNTFHAATASIESLYSEIMLDGLSTSPKWHDPSNTIMRIHYLCYKSGCDFATEMPVKEIVPPALGLYSHMRFPSLQPESQDNEQSNVWQETAETTWSFYLADLGLRHILGRVVETMLTVDVSAFADPNYPIETFLPLAVEFERQIKSWRESLPPAISLPATSNSALANIQPYTSRYSYGVGSSLMYKPFICYILHNPESASPKVLAMAQKGFSLVLVDLLHSNHTYRSYRKWWQLRFELVGACYLLLAATLSLQLPNHWHAGVRRVRSHLLYWISEAPFLESYLDVLSAMENYFSDWQEKSLQLELLD